MYHYTTIKHYGFILIHVSIYEVGQRSKHMESYHDVVYLCQHYVNISFHQKDIKKLFNVIAFPVTLVDEYNNEVSLSEDAMTYFLETKGIQHIQLQDESYTLLFDTGMVCGVDVSLSFSNMEQSLRILILYAKQGTLWKITYIQLFKQFDMFENVGFLDIYETIKKERYIDTLTKLNNRYGFLLEAQHCLTLHHEQCYAMIKFEIQDFHFIKRKFGYHIADFVLCCIGNSIDCSLKNDEICGKTDDDSFLLMYHFISKKRLAERILSWVNDLNETIFFTTCNIKLQFNFGVHVIEQQNLDAKEMLDNALYAQKNVVNTFVGTQIAHYEDLMLKQEDFKYKVLEDALKAMADQDLKLFIQPLIDIESGKVVAGEALVRWYLANGTIRYPNEFIPIFEEDGFILNFDFYMLKCICQKMQEWNQKDIKNVVISINQSRMHIIEDGYFEKLCELVDQYNIPHKNIILELTESAFIENGEHVQILSQQLHDKGFQLAIDDFGTGYASLKLLSIVQIDILKIDKSLLDDYDTNPKIKIILEKTIELAHQMDIVVICEGVETKEQLQFLKRLDCDIAQGYLFSKPIEADEYQRLWLNK